MQLTHLASPHRAVMTSQRVVVMSNLDGGRRQMLHVLSLMALSQASLRPAVALDGVALDGVAPGYNPGQLPSELGDVALGGLKPGTGRPLNALIKMRAETGIERVSPGQSPLFKAGQIFDELKTAQGGIASVVFAYPEGHPRHSFFCQGTKKKIIYMFFTYIFFLSCKKTFICILYL